MIRRTAVLTVILAAAFLVGCQSAPQPTANTGTENIDRNDGYSLLYDLVSDLKDVDKALIFRSKNAPFDDTIKAIAAMADAAHNQLDAFAKVDPGLQIKRQPLPPIEVEVRKSISNSEAVGLFTSKGPIFNRRLLLSQQNGLQYAEHLAKVIQKHESVPKRKEFLASLEKQAHNLREQVITLLATPHAE